MDITEHNIPQQKQKEKGLHECGWRSCGIKKAPSDEGAVSEAKLRHLKRPPLMRGLSAKLTGGEISHRQVNVFADTYKITVYIRIADTQHG